MPIWGRTRAASRADGSRDVARGGRARALGYVAFISYSHALDGELARALQIGLQGFAKPWYRIRALRVFRISLQRQHPPAVRHAPLDVPR
jgi:hypothetical protein